MRKWFAVVGGTLALYALMFGGVVAVSAVGLWLGVAYEWWFGPVGGLLGGGLAASVGCWLYRLFTGRSIILPHGYPPRVERRAQRLKRRDLRGQVRAMRELNAELQREIDRLTADALDGLRRRS